MLEICCDTGRVGIPIARTGIPLTGVDIVPEMIEQARRKSVGLPARWVGGDARSFGLTGRYGFIFFARPPGKPNCRCTFSGF